MRSDVKALTIDSTELGKLTGMSTDDLLDLRASSPRIGYRIRIAIAYGFVTWIVGGLASIVFNWSAPVVVTITGSMGSFFGLTQGAKMIHRKQRSGFRELMSLVSEVERYNDVLRIFSIKDDLDEAGNRSIKPDSRAKVLEALKLTREDLISALKVEKILRDNKNFIDQNPTILGNNLATVKALQINDQSSEWSHLLDQTLQVAIEVQEEMRKLQTRN